MNVEDAMRAAIARADGVKGTTYPNPPVGAVILDRDGAIAGVGATQPPGGPHAEVMALRRAGDRAIGGVAVVTLEPCNHHGRTPPCVDALVDAGVASVVYAIADPNPVAAGGSKRLADAGVSVRAGVLAEDVAGGTLREWLHRQRTGRPHVTWKFAASVDGRSAAADGSSKWITGEAARADVHRLRAVVRCHRGRHRHRVRRRSGVDGESCPTARSPSASRCGSSSVNGRYRPTPGFSTTTPEPW